MRGFALSFRADQIFCSTRIHTMRQFGIMAAMRTTLLFIVALCVAFPVLAALPPQRPDDLKKGAAYIVVGKVQAVYTAEDKQERGFVNRLYMFEVVVSSIEKGEGLKEAKVIYVKAWKPQSRPTGWAGLQGQNHIPEAGESGRLYLTQADDGSLSLMTPNGWEGKNP